MKTPSLNQKVGNLSGGNQQKIAMAKWLADRILVMDEFAIKGDIKNSCDYKEMSQSVMEHIHHSEDELRCAKAAT